MLPTLGVGRKCQNLVRYSVVHKRSHILHAHFKARPQRWGVVAADKGNAFAAGHRSRNSTNKADATRIDKSCPAGGTENALAIAGLRAATAASSLAATLFGSTQNDDPKLLLFSDSVQDAAHRAAVIETRNLAVVLRKALVQHLDALTDRKATLADLVGGAPLHSALRWVTPRSSRPSSRAT